MLNTESIASAAIMLLSVLLLVWVIPAHTPPYQGYGVSPALIPNVSAAIMLALSFLGLLRSALGKRAGKASGEKIDPVSLLSRFIHISKFMLPSFLLFPAIGEFGFFPAGIVFMLLIQFICGQRNWLKNALVSVLVVAGLYAAMRYGFSIAMP
ncbi:tripartite tricarboxylate transporter TctB family protein [Desulfovibrio sp. OttesenSCG-928-C06]|nr:tripartite tricarboxylate transporter TctB family protein [Desulfovibrio sp. OttesenSCG-928-C06]